MRHFVFLLAFSLLLALPAKQAKALEAAPVSQTTYVVSLPQPGSHTSFSDYLQDEPKKRSTAFILALISVFVLPIGLHRFYLGYKKDGIFMLVLTLTGIGAIVSWIWSIIDLIKIIDGTLKPADGSEYVDAGEDLL